MGTPADGDALLFAVPVCAPYTVLASYRYKAKLTPGAQKKGKAAKQAISLFGAAAASGRERELIGAMPVDEAVRVMLGNVKIASAGLAAATRGMKADRKAAATAAASERKQGSQGKGD